MINGSLTINGLDSTSYVGGLSIKDDENGGFFINNSDGFTTSHMNVVSTKGMYVSSSEITASDFFLFDNINTASDRGGAMSIINSDARLTNMIADSNQAGYYGGGIYVYYSTVEMDSMNIIRNYTQNSSGAGGITQKTLQEGKNNMNQNEIKSLEAYNDLFKSDFWITEAKQDFRNFSEGTEVITGNPTTKKCDGEYTSWCGIKIKTTDIQNRFDKIVDKAMDNDQLDLSNDTRAFIKSSKELGDEFRKNLFDF